MTRRTSTRCRATGRTSTRAFEKKLSPDETDGTFTISNLHTGVVVRRHPAANQGATRRRDVDANVILQKNGMIGMVKQMTITLTCDHRHIYGADAAKFLVDLAGVIENDTSGSSCKGDRERRRARTTAAAAAAGGEAGRSVP